MSDVPMRDDKIVAEFQAARKRANWQSGLVFIAFILFAGIAEIIHLDQEVSATILGIGALSAWLLHRLRRDDPATTCPFCGAGVPNATVFADPEFCRQCGKRLR